MFHTNTCATFIRHAVADLWRQNPLKSADVAAWRIGCVIRK
jgi:hypothetical protein